MGKNPVAKIVRNPSIELISSKKWMEESGLSFLIISSGVITCLVNNTNYYVSDKNILILSDSLEVNSISGSNDFKGYLITFDSEFTDRVFASDYMVWKKADSPIVNRLSKEEISLYKSYISILSDNLEDKEQQSGETAWLLAKAFVITVLGKGVKVTEQDQQTPYYSGDVISNRFIRLVRQYGDNHRDLEFYANKLCITPKYLSRVISKSTGKKASKWIEDFVVTQAMQKLKATSMNVNQISDSLNFISPSDFCRTFRKNTGMTPLKYRKANL